MWYNKKEVFGMKKKRRIVLSMLAALLLAGTIWIWIDNSRIVTTHYTVTNGKVPDAFDGFVIAQVSYLHNAAFGEGNARLLDALAEAEPDIIVITGDLIDSRRTDVETAAAFAEAAVTIAPVYYVAGNHEGRVPEAAAALEKRMTAAGVHILHNERMTLSRGGAEIDILGLDDPSGTETDGLSADEIAAMTEQGRFTVLLSHRPDLFARYCASGVDLVFSGHAHGGQIRLPLFGGLFAPHQGFFPDYTQGCYTENGTTMVVSRGLGNSLFPFRVNNPPELVVVCLHRNQGLAQN